MRNARLVALVLAATLATSSCAYFNAVVTAQDAGGPRPWWCDGTEEIPVTEGPAAGTVDWYAGTHKDPIPG